MNEAKAEPGCVFPHNVLREIQNSYVLMPYTCRCMMRFVIVIEWILKRSADKKISLSLGFGSTKVGHKWEQWGLSIDTNHPLYLPLRKRHHRFTSRFCHREIFIAPCRALRILTIPIL